MKIIKAIVCLTLFQSCSFFEKKNIDLLIVHGTIITMDGQKTLLADGAIAIAHDKIVEVGQSKNLQRKYTARKVIDAHNSAILPGFINAHTHAAMTLLRGYADDVNLKDWLEKHIWPEEKKIMSPEAVYCGTKLACIEMIRGGTTTFADMYFFEEEVAKAVVEMGMRAVLGKNPVPYQTAQVCEIDKVHTFMKKWAGHPLIHPAISAHSIYSCSKERLIETEQISKQYNVPLLMHLAETTKEVQDSLKNNKMRPVDYLYSIGLLTSRLVAAHCVHITPQETALLKKENVGIVHCPCSNMKLSSGVAPIQLFITHNLRVGLGTDGAASNNALDMMAEMKIASLLQKEVTKDPMALSAYQTLEMATIGSARALHMEAFIGSLEAGKKADIILIRLNALHQIPVYNVVSQLVYASKATDVRTVIVNGAVVMENRKLIHSIDEPNLRKQIKYWQEKIVAH